MPASSASKSAAPEVKIVGGIGAADFEAELAGKGRHIAVFFEEGGVALFPEFNALEIATIEIATVLVFVDTGENAGSAGHADGGGVVVIFEEDAVGGELIEIGRFHVGVAVATHGPAALVVGQ